MPFWDLISNLLMPLASMPVFMMGISFILFFSGILCFIYHRHQTQGLHKKLAILEHSLRTAHNSAMGMGQQIITLEKQLTKLSSKKQRLSRDDENTLLQMNTHVCEYPPSLTPAIEAAGSEHKFNKAKELLAEGISVNEVSKICQLSFAEVSLLQALNRSSENANFIKS